MFAEDRRHLLPFLVLVAVTLGVYHHFDGDRRGSDNADILLRELDGTWTEEAGRAAWYLYDLATGQVLEEPAKIVEVIRCRPDTPRHCTVAKETLSEVRAKVERHIRTTYLKSVQAPVGVKPALKAWMELN